MADLTAIILTRNEEKNIEECIRSVQDFCSRICVVDSFSTDQTVSLAENLGADVYQHTFSYYADQFNWGIDHCSITTGWILRLDADERFTPEVCSRCEALMREHADDSVNGIVIESDFYFLGKVMRHGGSKKRKIMIFKKGIGRIEDRKRDAHTVLSEGTTVSIREHFKHYDFKDLTSYINRYNWYSIRELQDYQAFRENGQYDVNTDPKLRAHRKKKFTVYYRAPMFIRAWLWFVYKYYLRLGFLDGVEGYIYCFFENYWYRFLVDAKIYEQKLTGSEPEDLKALN
jgi:glycosyltransferase involved in cell wall biosynthesis